MLFFLDIKGIAPQDYFCSLSERVKEKIKYFFFGGGAREGRMKYGETRNKSQKVEGLI